MTTDTQDTEALLFEPDFDGDVDEAPSVSPGPSYTGSAANEDEPPSPINWSLLTGDEAESEWLDLNAWVHWLRATYGLPPTVIPPYWHRHDELVWELSALHQHWLNSYDPEGSPSGPFTWHRDFAEARNRLRDWVSTTGTRIDRDRATRQTSWPGEEPAPQCAEVVIEDREVDFVKFLLEDIEARRQIERRVRASS